MRYDVVIGHALKDIAAGSWVHERLLEMPAARGSTTCRYPPSNPRRNRRWTVTRSRATAIPTARSARATYLRSRTTVQCVAGVIDFAVARIKAELLPKYPNVDDVVGLAHTYGCGVAIDAPDAEIPIRTLAQHQPQPELRRRGDGREPRLREAAARAADAAGLDTAGR